MANIKSKITRIKTNEKARVRNAAIKSRVRGAIKKVQLAVDHKEDVAEVKLLLQKAHKEIDKSVSKGVFHRKNGARKTSRLDAYVKKHQHVNH